MLSVIVMAPAFSLQNAKLATGDETGKVGLLDKLETPNRLRQLAYTASVLGFGVVGAWLIYRRGAEQIGSPLLLGILLGTLAIIAASLLWSDSRSDSFRRIVIFSCVAIGALGIGASWRPRDFIAMVLLVSGAMLFVGILAEIRVGSLLSGDSYRFSGLLHPNKQAASLALFVVAATVLWLEHRRWLLFLAVCFAAGMLVLTGSRGGVLTCGAGLAVIVWLHLQEKARLRLALAGGILLGITITTFAVVPSLNESLLEIARMGRAEAGADPSKLTGRLPIWAEVISYIQKRPILGYGYSGFWTNERIYRLSYIHGWEFSNAHSSYLDSLLSVGLVGFSLGAIALVLAIVRAVKCYAVAPTSGFSFLVAVVVMGLVNSLTESIFYGDGYEPLCVMIALGLIAYHTPTLGQSER